MSDTELTTAVLTAVRERRTPYGLSDMRAVDRELQRLRRAGRIVYTGGGTGKGWRLAEAPSDPRDAEIARLTAALAESERARKELRDERDEAADAREEAINRAEDAAAALAEQTARADRLELRARQIATCQWCRDALEGATKGTP